MRIFYFFVFEVFSLEIETVLDLTGETIADATTFLAGFESLTATTSAVSAIGNLGSRNSPRISSVVFSAAQISTLGDDLFGTLDSMKASLTSLLADNSDESVEFLALQSECETLDSGKQVQLVSYLDSTGQIVGSVNRCDGSADDLTTSDASVEMSQVVDSSCVFDASSSVITIAKALGDTCGTTYGVEDNEYRIRNTLKVRFSKNVLIVIIFCSSWIVLTRACWSPSQWESTFFFKEL